MQRSVPEDVRGWRNPALAPCEPGGSRVCGTSALDATVSMRSHVECQGLCWYVSVVSLHVRRSYEFAPGAACGVSMYCIPPLPPMQGCAYPLPRLPTAASRGMVHQTLCVQHLQGQAACCGLIWVPAT